jgi:hypothetical protein
MSGLQREDYVLKQARAIAAMLARIAGLRLGGETEKARVELEQYYTLLLGSRAALIRQVGSSTAAALLGSPEKIHAFADLLHEEAEQEKDQRRSAFLRGRAVELEQHLERKIDHDAGS